LFGIDSYLVALSSLTEPLCPEINKKGNFRDWSLTVPTIFFIPIRDVLARYQIRSLEFKYVIPLSQHCGVCCS